MKKLITLILMFSPLVAVATNLTDVENKIKMEVKMEADKKAKEEAEAEIKKTKIEFACKQKYDLNTSEGSRKYALCVDLNAPKSTVKLLNSLEEIPDRFRLNWDEKVTTEELKAAYYNSYQNQIKRSREKDKIAEEKAKKDICNKLDANPKLICLSAVQLEKTSTSAILPVKLYLHVASSSSVKAENRAEVMVLAENLSLKRMTEERFFQLSKEVCEQQICEVE